jgi:hypothetical protein
LRKALRRTCPERLLVSALLIDIAMYIFGAPGIETMVPTGTHGPAVRFCGDLA